MLIAVIPLWHPQTLNPPLAGEVTKIFIKGLWCLIPSAYATGPCTQFVQNLAEIWRNWVKLHRREIRLAPRGIMVCWDIRWGSDSQTDIGSSRLSDSNKHKTSRQRADIYCTINKSGSTERTQASAIRTTCSTYKEKKTENTSQLLCNNVQGAHKCFATNRLSTHVKITRHTLAPSLWHSWNLQ